MPPEEEGAAPSAWATFRRNLVRLQKDKLNPWMAARNTLGVALPLAGGIAFGMPSAALAMSAGALNVSFRDSDAPYSQRLRQMFVASVVAGVAVFAGALSGRNDAAAIILAGAWAFAAGMLVAISTPAGDLGVMSLVMLLVYAAIPQAGSNPVAAALLAFAGGLLQTALAVALWPLRRYVPERRALGELYVELSRTAAAPRGQSTDSPPATAQSLQAHTALAALDRDHSIESDRFRLLLSQAERMRLSLVTLRRLRARIEREHPQSSEASILERYFEICSRMLDSIGNSLLSGDSGGAAKEDLQELETLTEQLREQNPARSPVAEATVFDARSQMDALAGQIRSAIDLATNATPAGIVAFEQGEARKPWSLRLRGSLAILRANFTLESAACRHAIRLAVCVMLSDALARGFELHRSYWLPMTAAIVLKPDFTATFSRGVLRLAGTFAGLVFATVLFHWLPSGAAAQVAAITGLMFMARFLGPANYGILTTSITGLVVFLIAMTGIAPKEVVGARAINTAIGGAIALLAYWLWPTWERTQISEAMARMLETYRYYFRTIRESYLQPGLSFAGELESTRVAARLARSNLEASIERSNAEPGASTGSVRAFAAMLASSHRLAHALIALEAGLSNGLSKNPVPVQEAFRAFANDVELTLHSLSAALRGSALQADALPDLREDHHVLVHSGGSLSERYALLNVETDRITNSLNTLREEILRWIAGRFDSAYERTVASRTI